MDDRGQLRVTAWCMLAMAFATSLGFLAQQRRIDTLARQVDILERDSVHHGARLDAQTMAEAEAFRRIGEAGKLAGGDAARLPGWVDAMPVDAGGKHAGSASVCPECGLKQYPPPAKEHLRKP
jgi:hypothetical protein